MPWLGADLVITSMWLPRVDRESAHEMLFEMDIEEIIGVLKVGNNHT